MRPPAAISLYARESRRMARLARTYRFMRNDPISAQIAAQRAEAALLLMQIEVADHATERRRQRNP